MEVTGLSSTAQPLNTAPIQQDRFVGENMTEQLSGTMNPPAPGPASASAPVVPEVGKGSMVNIYA